MGLEQRYTNRARRSMVLANEEAQRLGHAFVGTEHLLLGLLKEGSGVGAGVLKSLGCDFGQIVSKVLSLAREGTEKSPLSTRPLTPLAEKAIQQAIREAEGLGHNYVGTEHLLLGLLADPESVAGRVLIGFGLRVKTVRDQVQALLLESHRGTDMSTVDHTRVTTALAIDGLRIARTCGIVRGTACCAAGLPIRKLLDVFSYRRQSESLGQCCRNALDQAYQQMVQAAQQCGANGLIGVRYLAAEYVLGRFLATVYGTAVVFEPAVAPSM